MSRRTDKTAFQSAFGAALERQLAKSSMRQSDLARATSVDPGYINRLMNGAKVSPEWADKIADNTAASPRDRVSLHRAAAATWGYKLDLTKKR